MVRQGPGGGVPGQAWLPGGHRSPFTSSFFSRSRSRRQAAPNSTPIHASAQRACRSVGSGQCLPRVPSTHPVAPRGGCPPSTPHQLPSPLAPLGTLTLVQGTDPERDPGPVLRVPDLRGWGQGHITHCLVLACCPPAACTDLPALPCCHISPQLRFQQPGVPGSLRRQQGVSRLCCQCYCHQDMGVPAPYRAGKAGKGRAGAPLQGAQRGVSPVLQQQDIIGTAGQCSWGCGGLGRVARGGWGGSAPSQTLDCSCPPTPAILTVPQTLAQPDLPTAPHLPQRAG